MPDTKRELTHGYYPAHFWRNGEPEYAPAVVRQILIATTGQDGSYATGPSLCLLFLPDDEIWLWLPSDAPYLPALREAGIASVDCEDLDGNRVGLEIEVPAR